MTMPHSLHSGYHRLSTFWSAAICGPCDNRWRSMASRGQSPTFKSGQAETSDRPTNQNIVSGVRCRCDCRQALIRPAAVGPGSGPSFATDEPGARR
jgi:hypothetical protein